VLSGQGIEGANDLLCPLLIHAYTNLEEVRFTRLDACTIGDLRNADAVVTPYFLKAEMCYTMPFLRTGEMPGEEKYKAYISPSSISNKPDHPYS
jgi:hypothetical protein